ncbi:MAG: radical SAM family heme chaperone HemW, partial [Parvularculaceae bacterium]
MTPLGLYIHWPYCTKVCPYCDFNVVRARHVDIYRWREVLLEDLSYWAVQSPGYLHSIYFGGGTPSLMPPSLVAQIIEAAKKLWCTKEPLEITLEANPTDAEKMRFSAFRDAGVNRLSLGVQSFDDKALQFLGRNHDAAEARRGIETAQTIFARTNFDLIYGLPNQTRREWCDQLTTAIDFGAGHLSIYQLTIEQGTAFAKAVARGAWQPIAQVQEAALYDIAQEICDRHGLRAYEVSNHAKPGEESV